MYEGFTCKKHQFKDVFQVNLQSLYNSIPNLDTTHYMLEWKQAAFVPSLNEEEMTEWMKGVVVIGSHHGWYVFSTLFVIVAAVVIV